MPHTCSNGISCPMEKCQRNKRCSYSCMWHRTMNNSYSRLFEQLQAERKTTIEIIR